jgi:hypothetical protein
VKAEESKDFAIAAVADEEEDRAREVFAQLPSTTAETKALYEEELRRRENVGIEDIAGITADVHTATSAFVKPKSTWQKIKSALWLVAYGAAHAI